ncbi:MAG: prepilin-type N-terminal cleavage/methylation domain-containing protein [Mariprofundus sp.]
MSRDVNFKCSGLHGQNGFTLIEMMISMAIGLVILAGLTTIFVSFNASNSAAASRTERMSDLYLASHIIQTELRQSLNAQLSTDLVAGTEDVLDNLTSRGVSKPASYPTNAADFDALPYWDATSKTLTYQDMDGNVGIFQYQRTSNERIYWLRPLAAGVSGSATFQELMRDLNTADGFEIFNPSTHVEVTTGGMSGGLEAVLRSTFKNENKVSKDISLTFKIWPRN